MFVGRNKAVVMVDEKESEGGVCEFMLVCVFEPPIAFVLLLVVRKLGVHTLVIGMIEIMLMN